VPSAFGLATATAGGGETNMLVSLEKLKPGMILAEPVYNHQETLLLDAGKRISAKAVRIFKSWGVTHVKVRDRRALPAKSDRMPGSTPESDIALQLRRKFADVLDDPVMVVIMQAAGRSLSKLVSDREKS